MHIKISLNFGQVVHLTARTRAVSLVGKGGMLSSNFTLHHLCVKTNKDQVTVAVLFKILVLILQTLDHLKTPKINNFLTLPAEIN